MSDGFGKAKVNININTEEINNIIKKYKKIKKLMKSSVYEVRVMDNTETTVSNLLKTKNT